MTSTVTLTPDLEEIVKKRDRHGSVRDPGGGDRRRSPSAPRHGCTKEAELRALLDQAEEDVLAASRAFDPLATAAGEGRGGRRISDEPWFTDRGTLRPFHSTTIDAPQHRHFRTLYEQTMTHERTGWHCCIGSGATPRCLFLGPTDSARHMRARQKPESNGTTRRLSSTPRIDAGDPSLELTVRQGQENDTAKPGGPL